MTSEVITIPARSGKAGHVSKGQQIRVTNTHGEQVVDTWAFNATELMEFMSMEHSRAYFMRLVPRPAIRWSPISGGPPSRWWRTRRRERTIR